jgi:hypothetical protein
MTDTPSPLAQRITRQNIAETGYHGRTEEEILGIVNEGIKDQRPLAAYSQSLKEIINRIIHGGEPELKAIAKSLGIAIDD